jgi:hypothetical protein
VCNCDSYTEVDASDSDDNILSVTNSDNEKTKETLTIAKVKMPIMEKNC